MSPNTCAIFLNGFCPKKKLCDKSHDVKNCTLGPNCTNNNCNLRHPPFCVNFLQGKCGFRLNGRFIAFSKCAFFHPAKDIEPTFPPIPPPLLPIPRHALQPPTYHHTLRPPILHSPHQPPYHPPPGLLHGNPHRFPHGVASTPAVEKILTISDHSPENNKDSTWYGRKIQDLENQIHKLSERLAINNKPGLDAAEGGMNINRHIKKFLDHAVIWSEQLEALSKHSEQQAKLVTDMVGTLEREMEELRTKVSKLEKEIAKKINTVTKEEMEHKFAGIAKEVGRVATLEKAVSKLEEDRANIKPDSHYLDLIEKQTAKKSVAQNNEIASISSKVTALGKVVTQHTTTLEHDLVVKVNKLQKEVAMKINSEGNDNSATDTQSIIKKIAVIEQNLQTMDTQIGKQFLGNDTRLTTIENHNRCKNCKSNPCLDGKPITSENFVHKAYYKGSAGTKKNSIYGHTYIGGFGEYQGEKYTGKWICYSYLKDIFPREEFTQAFTENVKSLKFSCHR